MGCYIWPNPINIGIRRETDDNREYIIFQENHCVKIKIRRSRMMKSICQFFSQNEKLLRSYIQKYKSGNTFYR